MSLSWSWPAISFSFLSFLFGSCTGRLLELFSIVWFRRIISYHWQRKQNSFQSPKENSAGGQENTCGQGQGPAHSLDFNRLVVTVTCVTITGPGTTALQRRAQFGPFRWVPLTQWKRSTEGLSSPHSGNEADVSVSGGLEFWWPQWERQCLPYEKYMWLPRCLWMDIFHSLCLWLFHLGMSWRRLRAFHTSVHKDCTRSSHPVLVNSKEIQSSSFLPH